jgi:hypothetical protein
MKQSAHSIGRPVLLFAVMMAFCCLTGCEAIHAWQNLDHDDGLPHKWMNGDNDNDELDAYKDLSLSGVLSKPALV